MSLRLRGERQRVVRRRVRNVFFRVVVFRRMIVVMEDEFRKRVQDSIQMRRRGEMDGNVIEIEGEHSCYEQTNPPARRFRREATSVM